MSHSGWRLGAAVGYTDSKISVDDRSSQADVSAYGATLYGGKSFAVGAGKLNFLAGAAYTWHDVNTKRYATVAGTPIARNAALAELGAEVAVSRDTTLALSYNGQYGGGNREHAGSLNVRWRY